MLAVDILQYVADILNFSTSWMKFFYIYIYKAVVAIKFLVYDNVFNVYAEYFRMIELI